jgi:hypothetical protein
MKEIQFEEYAYIVNFFDATFDFYVGRKITMKFPFEQLPNHATDFGENMD